MDKLLGAMDSAFSALTDHHHKESNRSPPPSPPRDDGSNVSITDRSTWAEIAASGNSQHRNDDCTPLWQNPPHRPQPSSHYNQNPQRFQNQQEDSEGRTNWQTEENSGWQTVGDHHHGRKPHQKVPDEQRQSFRLPPHKQVYAEHNSSVDTEPTDEELSNLSAACSRLWELDFNRLVPGRDYEINCGDGKKVHERKDMAEGPLFEYVSEDVFQRPTYARFYALLDNYISLQGVREHVTEEERQEEFSFIEEISRTAPIKYVFKHLAAQGHVSKSYEEFKKHLHQLWFGLYSRGGAQASSSAFEHVFIGEVKNSQEREVSGFHNWIKFYVEEAAGNVDYQGYILPRRRNSDVPDEHSQCLTIQFKWNNVLKPVSSTFVGVSPEFELALYALCFYAGEEDNFVEVGPYSVNIKCYRYGRDRIGSVFPIAEE